MSYDLTLIRSKPGTMRDWADFRVWEDADIDRLEQLEASGSPDWPIYQPSPEEADRITAVLDRVAQATGEDVGLDIGYGGPDVVNANLAYWPDTVPHLDNVVDILNDFAADLGPDWIWADQQYEKVSARLMAQDLRDVYLYIAGTSPDIVGTSPEEHKKPWDWRRELLIFVVVVAVTLLFLRMTDTDPGCAAFEVPGDEPGTCTVPCLDGESAEACGARAQQLWQDAGIDPIPVE